MKQSCWLLALLSVAACGAEPLQYGPDMPTGGNGLPAYEWVPRSQVGRVVSWEEAYLSQLDGPAIDALLMTAGADEFFSPVPHGAQVFRVRYTTQDKGRLVEATGLAAAPWDPDGARQSFPIVLFLHGTTGFMGECAPSYRMGTEDLVALMLLAAQGYVVAAPDYIGLDADADFSQPTPVKHDYLGVEQTAVGSLDLARATRALLEDGEVGAMGRATGDLVLWGGSQGGHAAFACDLVAPYYAPEFDVVASVALVPPTDLLALAEYAMSSPNPATAAFGAVVTAQHLWYEGTADLGTFLVNTPERPLATLVPSLMYSGCDAGTAFDGITMVSEVYQADVIAGITSRDWDALAPWSAYLRDNSIATSPIPRLRDTPTLFVLSENDTLVYTPPEREDFDRLCGQGWTLDYLECAGAGHTEGALWSLPEQLEWVEARLAGTPVAAPCQRRAPVMCSAQR